MTMIRFIVKKIYDDDSYDIDKDDEDDCDVYNNEVNTYYNHAYLYVYYYYL